MKFPRHYRLLRGPFEMAPFAAVFFLLVIFLMLGALLPTPGLQVSLLPLALNASTKPPGATNMPGLQGSLQPPAAADLPGVDKPTVAMAVDAQGRFYFANQIVTDEKLKAALQAAVHKSREPLTLVIHADKTVTYEQLVHLTLLAREVGIQDALLATLPRSLTPPDKP